MHQLILASASPRRLQLLGQIGLQPQVVAADIDESRQDGENDGDYVKRLAGAKARAVASDYPHAVVIGADTIISLDGHLIGKPRDKADAFSIWRSLGGRTHQVLTAVAVVHRQQLTVRLSRNNVSFVEISEPAMLHYWQSGEPQDKAGAYAIQGLAAQWISRIEGSYSGIMGLPLHETAGLLKKAGIGTLL